MRSAAGRRLAGRRLPLPGLPPAARLPGDCTAAQVRSATAPYAWPPPAGQGSREQAVAVAPARRERAAPFGHWPPRLRPAPAGLPPCRCRAAGPPPPLELGLPAGIEFRMGAGREAGSWELETEPGLGRGREGRGAWAGHS